MDGDTDTLGCDAGAAANGGTGDLGGSDGAFVCAGSAFVAAFAGTTSGFDDSPLFPLAGRPPLLRPPLPLEPAPLLEPRKAEPDSGPLPAQPERLDPGSLAHIDVPVPPLDETAGAGEAIYDGQEGKGEADDVPDYTWIVLSGKRLLHTELSRTKRKISLDGW